MMRRGFARLMAQISENQGGDGGLSGMWNALREDMKNNRAAISIFLLVFIGSLFSAVSSFQQRNREQDAIVTEAIQQGVLRLGPFENIQYLGAASPADGAESGGYQYNMQVGTCDVKAFVSYEKGKRGHSEEQPQVTFAAKPKCR